MIVCGTVILAAVLVSITVIATVTLTVRKRQKTQERSRAEEEKEGNELYGTYHHGVEYNVAVDQNEYYE